MAKLDISALSLLLVPGIVAFVTVYLLLTQWKHMDSDTALGIAIVSAVGIAIGSGMLTYFLPQY